MRIRIPIETLFELRRRLDELPHRSASRKELIADAADLFGVSCSTVYRALCDLSRPKSLKRRDSGIPRVVLQPAMERYCEIIAAMKVRTENKKRRHISTREAIRLLENFGIETEDGLVQAPPSLLKRSTVDHYLSQWGYDRSSFEIQQTAVRFEATSSNECWQFDLSPSDLKHLEGELPSWAEKHRGKPTLMLYSVVDDRSGVCYQEYHLVYGEDLLAGLRFLFRAMSPKNDERFPFQGIPLIIYMDNGPIAKSSIFRRVMQCLGVEIRCHMPAGKGGRRTTSRAKGKVERPFRTVKEVHETLYHFHQPETEEEANAWLYKYLLRYNEQNHRSEPHSRIQDWIENLPPSGIRKMCTWERFSTFDREPESRTVGIDARVSSDGTLYQVDEELTGQRVVLWRGRLDDDLFVEFEGKHYGPYHPVEGPIPINRYRAFKKTAEQKRIERIEQLASTISLPRKALDSDPGSADPRMIELVNQVTIREFEDPDPFHELRFPSILDAKRAIAGFLGTPLARLSRENLDEIDKDHTAKGRGALQSERPAEPSTD